MAEGPQQTAKKQRGRPFQKGKSGNPSGRPKKTAELIEIESLAKELGPEAVEKLAEWMRSDNAKASVAACNVILDRGFGKARQPIDATIRDERMVVEAPRPAADADTWSSQHGPH